MLLSIALSFIIARKCREKTYALLTVVSLALLSFFSVGIPEYAPYMYIYPTVDSPVLIWNPIPLSFPVYASITSGERPIWGSETTWYRLYFLSLSIGEEWMRIGGGGTPNFTVFEYLLYYSFFMLINIAGAAFGYWLSKTAFFDRIAQKGASEKSALRVSYSQEQLGLVHEK